MDPRKVFSLTETTQVDGVYIYEIDPPKFVKGVGTGIVGIVGEFEKGPVGEVVNIGSSAEFNRIFGGYGQAPSGFTGTWSGYSGFRAVSGKIWPAGLRIVRAARTGMAASSATIAIDTDVDLVIGAKYKGEYGNRIQYTIELDTIVSGAFNLTVTLDGESESVDHIHPEMTEEQLKELAKDLQLVDLSFGATGGTAPVATVTESLASGSDGTASVLANWTGGVDILLATKEVNILFAAEPEVPADNSETTNDNFASLNSYIKSAIEPTFTIGVLAGPSGEDAATAAASAGANRSDRLIYTWPWRKQTYADASPIHKGGVLTVPSNDVVASALANIDPVYDPACSKGGLFINASTVGLEYDNLNRDNYVTCNKGGVCSLEFDPELGYRVVTGITTDLTPGKEMIHRRRLADYLTVSVAKFLKFYQNQPITEDWKDQITGAISNYLSTMKTLVPVPYVIDYIVDDESVNDTVTEAQGIYKILMKVKTPASARYIVLLSQVGSTVTIEEKSS